MASTMNLGTLTAFTRIDTTGFKAGMAKIQAGTSKLSGVMGGLGSVASAFGLSFGRALAVGTAATGVAIKRAADLEAELTRVKSITGASAAEFRLLKKTAEEMGRTTIYSAQQTAEAMRALAMAGSDTQTIVASMPATLQLAQAAMIDIGSAANLATNIMAGFGIQAEDLAGVNDVLVATFTGANVTVEMLAETFKTAGPVAKSAGIEFNDLAAAAGVLGNAGINASLAGTGLRRAISAIINPSGQSKKAMTALGLSASDASRGFAHITKVLEKAKSRMTELQFLGNLATAFGERAGPQMAALVGQGSEALDKLGQKIRNANGLARKMQEEFGETTTGKLKAMQSAIDGLAVAFGDALAPAVKEAADAMAILVNSFAGVIEGQVKVNQKISELVPTFERNLAKMQQQASDTRLGFLDPVLGISGGDKQAQRDKFAAQFEAKVKTIEGALTQLLKGGLNPTNYQDVIKQFEAMRSSSRKAGKRTEQLSDGVTELATAGGKAEKAVRELGRALEFDLPDALRGSGLLNPLALVARGGFTSDQSQLFRRRREQVSAAEFERSLARRMGVAPSSAVGDRPPGAADEQGPGMSQAERKDLVTGLLSSLITGGGAVEIASMIGNKLLPGIGGALGAVAGTVAETLSLLHPVNLGLRIMGAGLDALQELWGRTRTASRMQEKSNAVLDKFAEILSQFVAPFEGVLDAALIFAEGIARAAVPLGNFSVIAELATQTFVLAARNMIMYGRAIATITAALTGNDRMLRALEDADQALHDFAIGARVGHDAMLDAADGARSLSQELFNLSDSPGFRRMRYGAETPAPAAGLSPRARRAVIQGGLPIPANKWAAASAFGGAN